MSCIYHYSATTQKVIGAQIYLDGVVSTETRITHPDHYAKVRKDIAEKAGYEPDSITILSLNLL